MEKKVTIEDIAKAVGCSKSLVSLALANKYGVSDDKRARIVMEAVRMGYDFRTTPQRTRSGSRRRIFVCFQRGMLDDSSYWMDIIRFTEQYLQRKGYFTQIYGWETLQEDNLLYDFYQSDCEGMISFGTSFSNEVLRKIASFGKPMVLIDSGNIQSGAVNIKAANYAGMYMAMNYLHQRGHNRIAVVGDTRYEETFVERRNGAQRFAFMSPDTQLILLDDPLTVGLSEYVNLPQLRESLRKREATAYLCINDAVAKVLYREAEALGLRIPEDISVFGFDNAGGAQNLRPPLTTCEVDRQRLALLAVEMMVMLQGEDTEQLWNGIKMEIPVTILERESVRQLE